MSDLTDQIRHDVAVLDLVREHLAGRHHGPEAVADCMACERDRYQQNSITLNTVGWKIAEALGDVPEGADRIEGNPIEQARELCDAWERERMRNDMMAMQRGAVLEAVHRMQLGNHTAADVAGRVEEIFRAGMAAEIKAGYDEQLAAVESDRDRLSDELAKAREELERPADDTIGLQSLARALRNTADGVEFDELVTFAGGDDARSILRAVARLAEIGSGAFTEDDADWKLLCRIADELSDGEQAQIAAFGAGVRDGITEEADRG